MTWKSLAYGRQQALLQPNYEGSIFLSTRDRIHLLWYRWINVNYIEIAGGSLHRFSFTRSGTPVHVSGVFQLIASFGLFLEKKSKITSSPYVDNFMGSIFLFAEKIYYNSVSWLRYILHFLRLRLVQVFSVNYDFDAWK